MYRNVPVLDVHGHELLPFGAKAFGPETGRTSDDLVPVIAVVDFLSEDDKIRIFNSNPARVIPALGKIR